MSDLPYPDSEASHNNTWNGLSKLHETVDEALDSDSGAKYELMRLLTDMGDEEEYGEGVLILDDPFAKKGWLTVGMFNGSRESTLQTSDEYDLDAFIFDEDCRESPPISMILRSLDAIYTEFDNEKIDGSSFKTEERASTMKYKSKLSWNDLEDLRDFLEDEEYRR
jgi:hypothetical protein